MFGESFSHLASASILDANEKNFLHQRHPTFRILID
jgi:hypothetical protein